MLGGSCPLRDLRQALQNPGLTGKHCGQISCGKENILQCLDRQDLQCWQNWMQSIRPEAVYMQFNYNAGPNQS